MSDLEVSIWQEYSDEAVTLVGITVVNEGQINQFVIDNGLTFPILKDTRSGPGIGTGVIYDQYYIPNQGSPYPRDFIIGTDGNVYYVNNEIDTEYMIAVIEMLLAGVNVSIKPGQNLITPDIHIVKAYPNPFNGSTNIIYTLAKPGNITINIFELTGGLVSGYDLGLQQAGRQNFHWSPIGQGNVGLPSGMYLYQIENGKTFTDGKILYLK